MTCQHFANAAITSSGYFGALTTRGHTTLSNRALPDPIPGIITVPASQLDMLIKNR